MDWSYILIKEVWAVIIAAHINKKSLIHCIGQITSNIDILMVSETKLCKNFLIGHFIIECFSVA